MSNHIAVDVGGTHMRAACYPSGSQVPQKIEKIATKVLHASPLERLVEVISSVIPEEGGVEAIAVALPGPTNPYKGIIYTAPNIPGWDNLAVGPILEEKFGIPVRIGNDANMAALGEWQFGAGKGHHHLIYLTVSTGIGGGILVDDRLLLGVDGLATELGHVTVLPDGPVCGCGKRGHIEAVASGTAIARWTEQQIGEGRPSSLQNQEKLTAREVAMAAAQGDALSISALERAGRFLGIFLTGLLHTFNPSIIILGGGVSRSGDLLIKPIQACMKEMVISAQYLEGFTLTTAALGDEAGLHGALALARSNLN
jgi:glucokinase